MPHLLLPNFYTQRMFKYFKRYIKAVFVIATLFFASCSANDLVIEEVVAHYVYDDTGSVMINVGFVANVSKDDVLFLTVTSPDGMLTWSDVCSLSIDNDKTYYTIGDIVLPYKISGEWSAEVARSDKSEKFTFSLSAPDEFNMPESLEKLYINRINGNVYTIRIPEIKRNDVIYISARNNVKKVTEPIIPIVGESEKSVSVNFKSSALIFSLLGDDGVVYRKRIII